MVHHLVPQQIVRAVERVVQASQRPTLAGKEQTSRFSPELVAA
jgi:hypothetical protein